MKELDFMDPPRSAYLHIPFCHRRCFYCDFAVVPLGDKASATNGPGSESIKSYLKLLHREILLAKGGTPLSTIYIGGGTPSLLTPIQIKSLIILLRQHFGLQCGAEITLEVDPASFNENDLEGFIEAGINRISLGGQSFDDEFLKKLGRRHTRDHLVQSCKWLNDFHENGFLSTWSLDLIQNLPGQSILSWKDQLNQAIDSFAPHLSIYDLTIEPGTVFALKEKKGELSIPNEDIAAEISYMTSYMLKDVGLSRYEISNFALPGHASRHNRVYWSGRGWWGFGLGATSSPWGKRIKRPRKRADYQKWIEIQENKDIYQSINSDQFKFRDLDELLIVGLRRREGVSLDELYTSCDWDKNKFENNLNALKLCWKESIDRGLLKFCGRRIYLSDPEGMEISNHILVQMMIWWNSLQDVVDEPILEELQ